MANYKQKYIKYLTKNKQLLSLVGGNNDKNSIIVSHNGRIRCILNTIDPTIDTEIRFKNCAILKFSVSITSAEISMIYSGKVGKVKSKYLYYVDSNPLGKSDVIFPVKSYNGTILSEILKRLHIKVEDLGSNTYTYYIVRHGEGEHNKVEGVTKLITAATTSKILDAELSADGVNQAKEAGQNLSTHLKQHNTKLNFLFCSDLKRTRQTLEGLLENLHSDLNLVDQNIVHILPCSHELNYDSHGCDGNAVTQISTMVAAENKTNCPQHDPNNLSVCKKLCCVIQPKFPNGTVTFTLNWSMYNAFYDGTMRGDISGKVTHNIMHCANTSMLSLSLLTINKINDRVSGWIENRKVIH